MIAIKGYHLEEFRDYLKQQEPRYGIEATVLHHTWKPDGGSYRGIQTIRNIQRYHRNRRGWNDIGANAYAAPDRRVYNGRPLSWSNYAHAYIKRDWSEIPDGLRLLANGDRNFLNCHGFGLETVGNFNEEDPTTSPAVGTALDVLAMVHGMWSIPIERMYFHRDVAYKSCPGELVSRSWARGELQQRMDNSGPKVLVASGAGEIDCNPAIEDGVTRADLRPLVEALGYDAIFDPMAGDIYLRRKP